MAKWSFIVQSKCVDPARTAEFTEWYTKIHLPDAMATPGFVRATLYENKPIRFEDTRPVEGQMQFIAVYEIESDDVEASIKALYVNMGKAKAAGRYTDLLVFVGRGAYKQVGFMSK